MGVHLLSVQNSVSQHIVLQVIVYWVVKCVCEDSEDESCNYWQREVLLCSCGVCLCVCFVLGVEHTYHEGIDSYLQKKFFFARSILDCENFKAIQKK